MATSLHQQLKEHYAGESGELEVAHGKYRIDAVRDGLLIEIQHGGLSAIRDKVRKLCKKDDVLVVKPIIGRKRLIKLDAQGGEVVSQRWSPKRGAIADLFHELVHFTRAFPHKLPDARGADRRSRGAALPRPRQAAAVARERLRG